MFASNKKKSFSLFGRKEETKWEKFKNGAKAFGKAISEMSDSYTYTVVSRNNFVDFIIWLLQEKEFGYSSKVSSMADLSMRSFDDRAQDLYFQLYHDDGRFSRMVTRFISETTSARMNAGRTRPSI